MPAGIAAQALNRRIPRTRRQPSKPIAQGTRRISAANVPFRFQPAPDFSQAKKQGDADLESLQGRAAAAARIP